MSLSNPTAKNLATRFMRWRGGEEGGGQVTYYDKEAAEEITVPLPFSFIVLDELSTVTGFNDSQQQGYWSNEVRDSNGTLVARTKQGIQGRGTWQQLKELGLKGLKFAQSVYIAFKDETGELQIGNIKMAGAAMSAWIDFKKQFDISQCAVFITDEPKAAKKGSNRYFVPVFEGQNMSDSTKTEAVKLDEDLQRYLNAYMQRKPEEEDGGAVEEEDEPESGEKETEVQKKSKSTAKESVEVEDLDKPANKTTVSETKPQADAKKLKPLSDVAF